MKHQQYQDELEQFLQDEVKQHRIYPSDHVWRNIRTELHGYRAWPALSFISLFIITALTVSTLLNNHPDHIRKINPAEYNGVASLLKDAVATNTVLDTKKKSEAYFNSISSDEVTASTFADLDDNALHAIHTSVAMAETVMPELSNDGSPANGSVAPKQNTTVAPVQVRENNSAILNFLKEEAEHQQQLTDLANGARETAAQENKETAVAPVATGNVTAVNKDVHASADEFLKDFTYSPVTATPRRKNSRIGMQFYITPSTSYRKLSDQKLKEIIQPASATTPVSQNSITDVNNVVRHKPAAGLELGFALLYNISDRLTFKTGAQLNVRQYYIETYETITNDLANLSLINYRGVENIVISSPYNNNVGYKQTQLDNKVYQLSIPLGLQWEMIRSKHFSINSEASVQPTMTLNKNVYLLSTDFRHYADGNAFFRKWNVNTSVGLNISYKSGNTSWQIGPQVRYQHLPTYNNFYPIKEYLIDYGIRIGFTRQLFK